VDGTSPNLRPIPYDLARARALQTEAGYSNWNGWELQGKPVLSLIRGTVVLQDGALKVGPGHGTHLPRGRLA